MNRETLFEYVARQYGTEPEHPWTTDPDSAVLRHTDNGKWYAVVMRVPRFRLGSNGEECVDIVNVKCDPLLTGSLRMLPGVLPAYHMNKTHWITLLLDGSVADDTVQELINVSYSLTVPRQKPKKA